MGVLLLGRHENGAFAYEFTSHGVNYGGKTMRFHTYEAAEDAQIAHLKEALWALW